MAYIGRNPAIGTQKVLDSLESQFNGSLTTFDLRYNSNTIYPVIDAALIVSLGGVLQEPGTAYTVASDQITFASAPPAGTDCWILLYSEFGGAAGATANLTVGNNLTVQGLTDLDGNIDIDAGQITYTESSNIAKFADDAKLIFGDSDDLEIYHDGSESVIHDNGTGPLKIRTNKLEIKNALNLGTLAVFPSGTNGAELYYNNSKKFEVISTGITVTGTALATSLSTGASGTGINISTNTISGPATLTIDPAAVGDDTGTVEIKGNLTVQGTTTTINSTTVDLDHLSLGDSEKAFFGSGDDLEIFHNGSGSFIRQIGTGNLFITALTDAADISINSDDGSGGTCTYIKADGSNGKVKLHHYGTEKLQTTASGVTVSGTVAADGVSLGDGEKIIFGDDEDLRIFHDNSGSQNLINSFTSVPLVIMSNGDTSIKSNNGDKMGVFKKNAGVELYFDDNKKIETTNTGATVTGALEVSAATNITVGGTALPSLTGLLGGSLSGTLGAVTMAYLPAAPTSPVQGQFYFNSLSSKAQIYTGSSFVDLVPSGGGGGGGGGGSSTDANATFRKYTYSISSTTNSVTGSSDLVTSAGDFVTGRKYTIKTVGTTDFTAIGASANTVGVVFDATGAGSGSGDAFDTLVYSTGGGQNVEVYVNGVKVVEGATNDYVATSGTSVNFVSNLSSGDVVDIQVYELLTNDAFVLATGGTFSGNVGINTSTINNRLHIHSNANEQGILLTQSGDNYSSIISDADRTDVDKYVFNIEGKWDGNKIARISFETGDDTTNKDNGRIKFFTAAAGTPSIAMRIDEDGKVGVGGDHDPLAPLHVRVNTASLIRLERASNANAAIRYENDTSQMFAGLSTSATFFGISTSENIAASTTQFVVTRATGNVGIGITNPSAKLHVVGDIKITNGSESNGIRTNSDGKLQFMRNNIANNTPAVTINDEDGFVGIGTESPESLLDVKLNSSVAYDPTDDAAQRGVGATVSIRNDDGTTNSFAQLTFDTAPTNQSIARIVAIRTGTSSNDLAFVVEGGNTKAERLRIKSNGNVGIGTNDPKQRLQVDGNIYLGPNNADNGVHSGGSVYLTADGNVFIVSDSNDTSGDIGSGAIVFGGGSNTNTDTNRDFTMSEFGVGPRIEHMRIAESGNVGIGTNNPSNKTHIFGGLLRVQNGPSSTYVGGDHGRSIEIGVGLETSDSKSSFIDFHAADEVSGHGDNSFRIERDSGANGYAKFINKGAGRFTFTQNSVEGLRIDGLQVSSLIPLNFNNTAVIASLAGGSDLTATNIDHLWHNDTAEFGTPGSWVFNSDTTYKSETSGTFSNIKVGHVYVNNGDLGTSAGDIQDLAKFFSNCGNATSIRIQAKRKVAGTNWTSAGYKIFCHTDSTEQGYIEFNPQTTTAGDGNYDVAIGSGSNELVRFSDNGNVGIGTVSPAYKLEVEGDIKVGELGTLWFSDTANSVEKIVGAAGELSFYADADCHFYESDANVRRFTVDVNNAQLDLGNDLDNTTAQVHFDYHDTSWINGSLFGLGTTSPTANLQVEYGSGTFANNTIRIGTTNDLNVDRIYSLSWGDPTSTLMGMGPYSTTRGVFGSRSGLGIHIDANDEFSVRSNSWNKLFGVEGGTGKSYFQGNVGIGTTNPTQKLEVKGGSIFIADDNYLITNRIRCGTGGQELILTAGESYAYIGQSPSSQYPPAMGNENVYLVAESGLIVYSSSGNWVNAGAVRRTGTFCDTNGNGSLPGTLSEGSDARLKTNIRTIPNALEKVKSLRGAIFNRVDKDNKEEIGLIAQEVEEVLPQVVEESEYTWEDENMKSIGYGKMVGLLVEAIKEQQELIGELQQRLDDAGL